jgi:hypothetical protein
MSQEQQDPVVARLTTLESRLGEVEEQAGEQAKGWMGRFSKGQVVIGFVTGLFSVGTVLFGWYASIVRAPSVELSFHNNIEARWDAKERRLSFDCYLLADNTKGTAGDTLQAVRAALRNEGGAMLRLGKIELKDDSTEHPTPFFVVKEGQSIPVRVTVASTLTPETEPLVRQVGLYTLVLEFKAKTSLLTSPAQTYCFYLGKNAADYLVENGQLLPEPQEPCDARLQLASAGAAGVRVER